MKFAVFVACLFFAVIAKGGSVIVHEADWNDLNKNGRKDVYEDPSQPVRKRVADLLKRMTLDEKIGQLWQTHIDADVDKKDADLLRNGRVGACLGGTALVETPVMRNKLQRIAVEQSRLGIPLVFGYDSIHGFRTVFPIPLAQACAWEPELFQRTQTISARETAAAGTDWIFAPMVDLARDPRWGRIAESFGEDPWLGALDSAACVRGFQGIPQSGIADPDHVIACLKHYVGYGAAEGGRDYNTTDIPEFTLRNFYLPPFKAGVDAGVWTVMSAFNCLSGIPASGNRHTLTEILRNEWHFPGFVVSDSDAVKELVPHGVAADEAEAARRAITAGLDMEMVSTTYRDTLKTQVEQGTVPESVVNEAVRRVLTVKFTKGLFDHPYADETHWQTAYLRPDALALAREAAAKSCVLLKNDNHTLPISKQTMKVALVGPLAENAEELVGSWCGRAHSADIVSLPVGLREKLPADARLTVTRGCAMVEPGGFKMPVHLDDYSPLAEPATGTNEIAEAAVLANAADVVILALGEPRDWSGESSSRSDLGLPGRQQELFDAVAATGKPVIVVLFNGRPLAVPAIQEKAAAILEAWFPGIQGGNGVADVLFGDVDPAGRLTTTFPRTVGQVPFYYNHLNTGRPGFGEYRGNYVDGPTTPLYPFGFGLTYTTFEYGKEELSAAKVKMGQTLAVGTRITNTGSRPGTEVAQLYIRDVAATAGARPVRELKGFQKVFLQPGENRAVNFTISNKELGYYDAKGNWLVEPGKFQVWIAKDSASGDPAEFELVK